MSYLGLWTWDLCEVVSPDSQTPCSQWLRLYKFTSNDLGLKTWDMCEYPPPLTLCYCVGFDEPLGHLLLKL